MLCFGLKHFTWKVTIPRMQGNRFPCIHAWMQGNRFPCIHPWMHRNWCRNWNWYLIFLIPDTWHSNISVPNISDTWHMTFQYLWYPIFMIPIYLQIFLKTDISVTQYFWLFQTISVYFWFFCDFLMDIFYFSEKFWALFALVMEQAVVIQFIFYIMGHILDP